MTTWLKDALARPLDTLRVLIKAWPTWAAAITALVAVVAEKVVPLLPGGWVAQAAGYCAAVLAAIAAISAAVARVTPILIDERGLLPLPAEPALEFEPDRLAAPPEGG